MPKTMLRTIRFTQEEDRLVQTYLKQNPSLESISSLGRIAIMEFVHTRQTLPLRPLTPSRQPQRPPFLWDYNLTDAQVHETLRHAPFEQRKWLIARILERAPWQEVSRYLTVEQIRDALPHLRMDPKTQRHWQEAIDLWTSRTSRS